MTGQPATPLLDAVFDVDSRPVRLQFTNDELAFLFAWTAGYAPEAIEAGLERVYANRIAAQDDAARARARAARARQS